MAPTKSVYDVIVIGAGIEGSSSAYNLAKSGKSVLLLEQFPLPHTRGSSHGQSRITRYAYDNDFYVRMMLDAFPMWAQLAKEAGEELFINCGELDIRSTPADADRVVKAMSTHNVPYELLKASQIRTRFPAVSVKDSDLAVFDPSGGMLRADRCLAAFQKVFKSLGGTIHDSEKVLEIKPGSPTTVQTSCGLYAAHNIVIAAGPWAGQFTSALGLKLKLKPIRVLPMYWRIRSGFESSFTPDNFPCFIDGRTEGNTGGFHYYGCPSLEYPGLVKVAHHDGPPADPDTRDIITEDGSWLEKEVTEGVRKTFPGLEPTPAIVETCMYTITPDAHPYIDRHPKYPNIIIAAGFSGHGFKLAPAVGKAITELVGCTAPTYDMKPFKLSRFDAKANL